MFESGTKLMPRGARGVALAAFIFASTNASADFVGAGFGYTTEYLGSDSSIILPIASFEVNTSLGTFKNNELGVQWDILESAVWNTGPIVRINTGRGDSINDEVIAALPEVEAGVEAGWFVGSGFRLASVGVKSDAIVIGSLNVTTNIGAGHGGTVLKGSLGLVTPVTHRLRVVPSVSVNFADDNFGNAFYGVAAEDANEQLDTYRLDAGLLSAQIAAVAFYQLNSEWSLTGTAAYTQLQGDASNSPIVARGDDAQLFTGVALNYLF